MLNVECNCTYFTPHTAHRTPHTTRTTHSRHPRWKLTDIQGGLVRLVEYRFVRVPDPQTDASTIVLVVEAFEHVGGDGSHVLGDPRYIMSNPAVAGALSLWKSAPFAHGLEGRDLQFLTATCTQTLHSVQTSYPVTIADGDWQISEAQTVRLAAVHLPRYETFQYASESDEEPVPMPQKRRLSFSDLQGGVPTSLSLQTQDMRFSQVAGASTPNGALSFGASTPAPAPAEYPDYASW